MSFDWIHLVVVKDSITFATNATLSAFPALSTPFFRVDLEDAITWAKIRKFCYFIRVGTGLGLN